MIIAALTLAGWVGLYCLIRHSIAIYQLIRYKLRSDDDASGIGYVYLGSCFVALICSWIFISIRAEQESLYTPIFVITGIGMIVWVEHVARQLYYNLEWEFHDKAAFIAELQKQKPLPTRDH